MSGAAGMQDAVVESVVITGPGGAVDGAVYQRVVPTCQTSASAAPPVRRCGQSASFKKDCFCPVGLRDQGLPPRLNNLQTVVRDLHHIQQPSSQPTNHSRLTLLDHPASRPITAGRRLLGHPASRPITAGRRFWAIQPADQSQQADASGPSSQPTNHRRPSVSVHLSEPLSRMTSCVFSLFFLLSLCSSITADGPTGLKVRITDRVPEFLKDYGLKYLRELVNKPFQDFQLSKYGLTCNIRRLTLTHLDVEQDKVNVTFQPGSGLQFELHCSVSKRYQSLVV
ncbi:uncharacterized protein LOC144513388 [Sander vitreus]